MNNFLKYDPNEMSSVTSDVKGEHFQNSEIQSSGAELEDTKVFHQSIFEISSVEFCPQQFLSRVHNISCDASYLDEIEKNYSSFDDIKKSSPINKKIKVEILNDSCFKHTENTSEASEQGVKNYIKKEYILNELESNSPVASIAERYESGDNSEFIHMDQEQQLNNNCNDVNQYSDGNEKLSRKNKLRVKERKILKKNNGKKEKNAHLSLVPAIHYLQSLNVECYASSKWNFQCEKNCESLNPRSGVNYMNLNGLDIKDQMTKGNIWDQPPKNCSVTSLTKMKDDSKLILTDKEVYITLNEERMDKSSGCNMKRKVLKQNLKKVKSNAKICSKFVSDCMVSSFQTDSIKCYTSNVPEKCKRMFCCKVCKTIFKSKDTWEQHTLEHNKLACKTCGKQFPFKSRLRIHERVVHTEERPFSCDVCGMCFKEKASLKRHQLTYTGERPFICSECGKNFATRAYLSVHKKLHSI